MSDPAREPPPACPAGASPDQGLQEQLKRLVRADRARFLSQRALELQLRRVRLLNRCALAASTAESVSEILRLGLDLLMAIYPFEQGLAWTCENGWLKPVAVHAVPGREEHSATRLLALEALPPEQDGALRGPLPWRTGELEPGSRAERLVAELEAAFTGAAEADAPWAVGLVVPIWQRPDALVGVLAVRRISRVTPVDMPLPSEADEDFLELAGKQLAVLAANTQLVDHLRQNYMQLCAAQEDLVKKERLAAVGELAAQIAHEVRNPLGAILNSMSALRRLVPKSPAGDTLIGVVQEESQRLERMVEDLLDFARPNPPRCQREDLEVIVRSALEGAARTVDLSGLELSVEADPGLPLVWIDAGMIRQAVLNLMINAAQAMSGKGRLAVRLALEQDAGGAAARVDVSDTGPGVSPELASRLFEPFVTTKATGTGLGLAVVRRLIEAHRGRATFRSAPGQGSTFSLHLPLTGNEPDRLNATAA